jgi:U3 small nucleolar RNA-associated protein 19
VRCSKLSKASEAPVEEGKAKWVDPFDADEPLPDLSRAVDSSMFEIEALRRSYYETTAKLVHLFEQPIGIADHLLGDVLTTDYNDLMNAELSRRVRQSAATSVNI